VGFTINYDQLFNWVDVHLYLVIVNKFLTNLLKQCLALTIFLGKSYILYGPHRKWAHAHYSLQLAERWTYVISLLLNSHQVKSRYHRRRTTAMSSMRSRCRLLVNYDYGGSLSSYNVIVLAILYKFILYNKDVILISVPWVITCMRLDLTYI
jgi:hypothetical protein